MSFGFLQQALQDNDKQQNGGNIMANFTDLLGGLLQGGLSPSSIGRTASALGGKQGTGGLSDLLGGLGQMMGGGSSSQANSGLGGLLGGILGTLSNNRSAAGSLGALAGAILGGGRGSTLGAIGGGGLAMLASIAFSALKKAGQQPAQTPPALMDNDSAAHLQVLEQQSQILVKAMINAAKADGQIDEAEVNKIAGKLDDNGLTQEEKNFFMAEASKPIDLTGVILSAGGNQELAAQIYAASLLAIEVDTDAEQQYMRQLAEGLRLSPEVINHIEMTLGMQTA